MIKQERLVIGGTYKHYKGNCYKVLGIVKHSETLEELVLYKALYESKLGKMWVRPKDMFLEFVQINGMVEPRFKLLDKYAQAK